MTLRVVARRLLELVVGLVLGSLAGLKLTDDLPQASLRRTDLLPPIWEWSPLYALIVVSWFAAWVVMWFSRRFYFVAMGWLLGVPVWLTIVLVYNYVTWGTFGSSPTIP